MDELLSITETARRMTVHERTVRRWIRDGKLSVVRIGGTIRVRPESLLATGTGSSSQGTITTTELAALGQVRRRLEQRVSLAELIVYGSAVRGNRDEESDLDLLVVTADALDRTQRQQVTDVVFDVNLEYGTNISALTVDADRWRNAHPSVLPIRQAIIEEGVSV